MLYSGKSTGRGLSGYLDMKQRKEHVTGKKSKGRALRLELFTTYYWGDQMKQDGKRGACSIMMRTETRFELLVKKGDRKEQLVLYESSWCYGTFTETELQEVTYLYLPPCRCK